MKFKEYKMRAECSTDLGRFLCEISPLSFIANAVFFDGTWFPDMEATFTSNFTLDELREKMAQIEDGHTMLESLNLADKYTGERYFI